MKDTCPLFILIIAIFPAPKIVPDKQLVNTNNKGSMNKYISIDKSKALSKDTSLEVT